MWSNIYKLRTASAWGPFCTWIMSSLLKYYGNSIRSNFDSDDPTRSQFCTCHNSWAAVACVELWPGQIIFYIRAIFVFTRFGLWAHILFEKWTSVCTQCVLSQESQIDKIEWNWKYFQGFVGKYATTGYWQRRFNGDINQDNWINDYLDWKDFFLHHCYLSIFLIFILLFYGPGRWLNIFLPDLWAFRSGEGWNKINSLALGRFGRNNKCISQTYFTIDISSTSHEIGIRWAPQKKKKKGGGSFQVYSHYESKVMKLPYHQNGNSYFGKMASFYEMTVTPTILYIVNNVCSLNLIY